VIGRFDTPIGFARFELGTGNLKALFESMERDQILVRRAEGGRTDETRPDRKPCNGRTWA
jgi:hypothetical protein